jgi:NAD(P)-dependent dehydrogenase (short-subunit alcohol dehydrogenase family)
MGALDGKVAIVTGGAGGLGSATARALHAEGARLVIADVDEEGGRAVAEELEGEFVRCDVSSLEENRALMARDVDLVFLNAGVASHIGVGDEFDLERYRRVMGINLDGVVFGTVAALPALKQRGGGAIVATASLAGLTGTPMDPLYAANKHAVVGLARSLGPSLELEGIRFNAVCPGYAESKIIEGFREQIVELGVPIIPAEQVAATVLNLFTGDMSGECWFVQAGREAQAFNFRGIPGPRA